MDIPIGCISSRYTHNTYYTCVCENGKEHTFFCSRCVDSKYRIL